MTTIVKTCNAVLSTTDWLKNQTDKPPTDCYYVQSETTKGTVYTITHIPYTNAYICDCKAWSLCFYNINQKPCCRTCKHIIAIRGYNNEQQRIVTNGGEWLYKPARTKL